MTVQLTRPIIEPSHDWYIVSGVYYAFIKYLLYRLLCCNRQSNLYINNLYISLEQMFQKWYNNKNMFNFQH